MKVNTYFSRLIDYSKQESGSAEETLKETFASNLLILTLKEFATMIKIFQ
jgi:hypothetical protein